MQSAVGVGPAWRQLAADAEDELHRAGVDVTVHASIDSTGCLLLVTRPRRADTSAVLGAGLTAALKVCETCGAPARVSAGTILTFLCDSCRRV